MTGSGVVRPGLCDRRVARAASGHRTSTGVPRPLIPPQPVHEHPISRARRRGYVQMKALPWGDAGLRREASDHRSRAGRDLPARATRARILSLHRIGGQLREVAGTVEKCLLRPDPPHAMTTKARIAALMARRVVSSMTSARPVILDSSASVPAARNAVPNGHSVQERSSSSSCMAAESPPTDDA